MLRGCWALALMLFAAVAGAEPIVVHDARGKELWLEPSPQRIVSLLPSLTETVWALGAGDRLVGVDRYSNWPPALAGLPRVGGMEDAVVEAVVALKPGLVLSSDLSRASDRLEALGLRVLRVHAERHADTVEVVRTLGQVLERRAEAERLLQRLDRELAAAATRVPAALRGKRVFFEVHGGWGASAGSFVGDTLARLGLVNIVPAELGAFPRLNPEFVVRADPDLLLVQQRDVATLAARPGWAAMPALRAGRVCGFAPERFEMLIRPGPRLGEGAAAIVDCLQRLAPEAAAARR
ncbi:ABC transporter substrate-binding protein [Rubrivivax gelatinosus]|uniref:Iron complex transport system substrate-binding protein n=1 Tax=Rubrivivax gelatinosus TaxID=28068 RepID=A0A4R2MWV1_RUBGE|nr:helical backbone metal receptor [Rubrivivax gelatinosus]MBK1688558.1 ABC transporter substrate-binding protein [Rubrivivax gelatinosus]TCP04673.1 iron complex transport system substrate-binding protein [Rubrivivax gelatinosus]